MLTNRGDRATALFVFPAALTIMFVVGAFIVDISLVRVRSADLSAAAAAAANDALAGLDVAALRGGGGVRIDPTAARAHAEASLAAGPARSARIDAIHIGVDELGRTVIDVSVSHDVDLVMAPAIGGLTRLTQRASARAVILGSAAPALAPADP